MVSLNPLAVSVTWGAGGSTKDRSLDLAGLTQLEHGIDTTLHLTCTNMVQGTVDAALRVRKPDLPTLIVLRAHPILTSLQEAKDRGIENILALRGGTAIAAPPSCFVLIYAFADPPRGSEHWIPTDSRFQHGADLVRYIKSTPEFAHFCVGVAGHFLASRRLLLVLTAS